RLARGHTLRLLGRNDEAAREIREALVCSDPTVLTAARNQLAAVYLRSGRLDEALETFQLALTDCRDEHARVRLMTNVALVQFERGEHEVSSETVRQARSIAE